jgi:hypothetical protein
MARRPAGAGLAQDGEVGDRLERVGSNSSSTPSNSKNFLYCLVRAFFGVVRMSTSGLAVERFDERHDGQAADELGDQPELCRSSGSTFGEQVRRGPCRGRAHVGPEPDPLAADPLLDDLLEPRRTPRRR